MSTFMIGPERIHMYKKAWMIVTLKSQQAEKV
jgi:hypothetical protein